MLVCHWLSPYSHIGRRDVLQRQLCLRALITQPSDAFVIGYDVTDAVRTVGDSYSVQAGSEQQRRSSQESFGFRSTQVDEGVRCKI